MQKADPVAGREAVVRPASVLKVLLCVWGFVVMGGLAVNLMPFYTQIETSKLLSFLYRFLQLDQEASLPTWFSAGLLLLNAVLLALIAWGGVSHRRFWILLSLVFFVLSLDETASMHEAVGRLVARFTLGGNTTHMWVIVAIPVLVGMLLYFWRFLWALPSRTRWLMLISGAIYVGGALIFEILGWVYKGTDDYAWAGYLALTLIEESFEMLGQIIFTYTLLDFMARQGFRLGFAHRA